MYWLFVVIDYIKRFFGLFFKCLVRLVKRVLYKRGKCDFLIFVS